MKQRRVRVVYSYVPANEDELELSVDDEIEVIDEVEEGWWRGKMNGKVGVFPSNFVKDIEGSTSDIDSDILEGSNRTKTSIKPDESNEIKPKQVKGVLMPFGGLLPGNALKKTQNADSTEAAPRLPPKPQREQARVLYSYEAQNDDELSLKEGDIINIMSKEIEDQGWWKGELNGKFGVFPDNFVEVIKPSSAEEPTIPSRPVKPDRPKMEKPPAPVSQPLPTITSKSTTSPSATSPGQRKDETNNKGSPKPLQNNKKPAQVPKASRIEQTLATNKPDVIPQENGTKVDSSKGNEATTDIQFASIDMSAKLNHLTTSRPKGPPSRRPPSFPSFPNDTMSGNEAEVVKENSDSNVKVEHPSLIVTSKVDTTVTSKVDATVTNKVDATVPGKVDISVTGKIQPNLPAVDQNKAQPQQVAPWIIELRKRQVPAPEDSNKETKGTSSPTKTSPSRFSGDFSSRFANLQPNKVSDESELTIAPTSILKPVKPNKPAQTTSISLNNNSNSNASNNASTVTTVTTTNSNSNMSNATKAAVINSSVSSPIAAPSESQNGQIVAECYVSPQLPSIVESSNNNELEDLRKELKTLKATAVCRKEFEELQKQVNELKEVVEAQKQSYGTVIRDLINDVADERKKLATLQIEVDRLRKLTTTV